MVLKGIDKSDFNNPDSEGGKKVKKKKNGLDKMQHNTYKKTMTQMKEWADVCVCVFLLFQSFPPLSPVSWPPLWRAHRCEAWLSQRLWRDEVIGALSFPESQIQGNSPFFLLCAERKKEREMKPLDHRHKTVKNVCIFLICRIKVHELFVINIC